MLLRIRSMTYLTQRVNGYELVDPVGHDLPRFEAGAHISVRLTGGLVRDFSLCNDPAECGRYCIAVLREGPGSSELHERVRVVVEDRDRRADEVVVPVDREAAEDARQAQSSWSRIGSVPDDVRRQLSDRFHRAIRSISERTQAVPRPEARALPKH